LGDNDVGRAGVPRIGAEGAHYDRDGSLDIRRRDDAYPLWQK
jgi:hypothetical protein